MAIGQNDGSIILSTKVDTNGLKKGLNTMKSMASMVGASFLAIGAAVATATVSITKMAVTAYADYEQLAGGVETLFKGSADKVKQYAENAFYTAGVSSNEYMKQVTSFSASLISSTAGDTEKAADIANMALVDISDNANKMGSSIESVTLAYQGFAKQQYMLLDNLKLGYGGTKTEMERLLRDAEAYKKAQGANVQYSIDNLADVYSAINAIQQKLGIAGTTMAEAEKTIAGSANMTKAAWQNVLAAIGRGEGIDKAINNLVFSLSKFFENIVPVVERALVGVGELISQVAPMLVQTVAQTLMRSIPMLVASVYKMIIGIAKGIGEGLKSLFTGKTTDVTAQLNDGMEQASDNTGLASDNMKDLAKNTKKAGKEAKKSLANFDDINILADKTAEAGDNMENLDLSGVGASAGDFGGIEMPGIDTQKIEGDLATIMTIAGGMLAALGVVLLCFGIIPLGIGLLVAGVASFGVGAAAINDGAISEKTRAVLSGLLVIAGAFLLVLGIILICTGVGIPLAIGCIIAGIGSMVGAVAVNWGTIKEKIQSVLETISQSTGTQIALTAIGIIMLLSGNIPVGLALLGTVYASLTPEQKESVLDYIKGKWEAIKSFWESTIKPKIDEIVSYWEEKYNTYIKPIFDEFKEKAKEIWDSFLEKFLTEDLPTAISDLKDSLTNFKEKVLDPLFEKFDEFYNNILVPLGDWIVETLVPIFEKKLADALVVIESALSLAGSTITSLLEQASNFVDLITALFTGDWESAWGSVSEIVKEQANLMIEYFETAINAILKMTNNMIDFIVKGLNKISIDVPEWLGGGHFGFNLKSTKFEEISIPRLAQGAVIPANKEFLAVLGDQKHGTNIEAPLQTIVDAFNIALANGGGASNGNTTVVLEIDGREFGHAVIEQGQRESRRLGTRMVMA